MEVFLVDRRTGDQHAADIAVDDSADAVCRAAHALFAFPADVLPSDLQLVVEGQVLCDEEPLSGITGLQGGCDIEVELTPQRFIAPLSSGGVALRDVPLWVRAQRSAVLAAAAVDPNALQFTHQTLQADREIALLAARHGHTVLPYVHQSLKADKEIVFEAVSLNPNAMKSAHKSLKSDRDFILSVVAKSPDALKHAHRSLQRDREIFLVAVRQSPNLYHEADDILQSDPDVILAVVHKHPWALLQAVSYPRDFVLAVLKQGAPVRCLPAHVWSDRGTLLAAVREHLGVWDGLWDDVKYDREVVLAVLSHPAERLEHVCYSPERLLRGGLLADRGVVVAAVRKNPKALHFAHPSLRFDQGFLSEAIEANAEALQYVPEVIASDVAFMMSVIQITPEALRHADRSLRANRDVVIAALRRQPGALQYAHESLRGDPEVIAAAAQ